MHYFGAPESIEARATMRLVSLGTQVAAWPRSRNSRCAGRRSAKVQGRKYRSVKRGSYLYQFGFSGRFSSGLDSFGGG